MDNKIEFYLEKYYRVEINAIPEEEGGGFVARLPQFGHSGIVADGNSPEEAIKELEKVKALRFEQYLKDGRDIPLPEDEPSDSDYSGKFITRIPNFLHRELAEEAEKQGVSLNMLVNCLLSSSLENRRSLSYYDEIKKTVESLKENICDLTFKVDKKLQFYGNLSSFCSAVDEPDRYKIAV